MSGQTTCEHNMWENITTMVFYMFASTKYAQSNTRRYKVAKPGT